MSTSHKTSTPGTNAGLHTGRTSETAAEKAAREASEASAKQAVSAKQAKDTKPLDGTLDEHVAALTAKHAETQDMLAAAMAQVRTLTALVQAKQAEMPTLAELPTEAEAQAMCERDPKLTRVLTQTGWYVPRVSAANPEAASATLAALVANTKATGKASTVRADA